jgi:hypothetical protein
MVLTTGGDSNNRFRHRDPLRKKISTAGRGHYYYNKDSNKIKVYMGGSSVADLCILHPESNQAVARVTVAR